MKKFYFLILFALIASAATFADAAEKTVTYTFKSNSWTATNDSGDAANWTSGKNGERYYNSGVQVTIGTTGANATCPDSYDNITKVVVSYFTNAKKGAGNVTISAGDTSSKQSITKPSSGGTTTRNLTYTFDSAISGNIKITVTCSENSIYIQKVAITYKEVETQCAQPTFNLEVGTTYTDDTDLVMSTTTEGATISYSITKDGSSFKSGEAVAPVTVNLNESGTFHVKATAKKDGLDDSELSTLNVTVDKTCPEPTLSIEDGKVFDAATSLTISSTLSGALIDYRITGPTGFETIDETGVAAPIKIENLSLNGLYTVYATAKKDGYKDSKEKCISFTIKKTCFTPYIRPTGTTFNEPTTFELTALTPGSLIDYTITNRDDNSVVETKTNCESGVKITLSKNGAYLIVATAHKDDYETSEKMEQHIDIRIYSKAPVFSVEEGSYDEAQTITLTTETEGAKIYYKINDAADYTVYEEPIVLDEDGKYVISAYTDKTDETYKSDEVTKTYTISLPITEPYELCTNANFLTEGTKIIFVGKSSTGKYYGMSEVSDNFITGNDVTIAADKLTYKASDVKVFTVEAGESGKVFSTHNSDGNDIYVASTKSSNQLSYATTLAQNCNWTISIASSGNATVTNAEYTSGKGSTLRYNQEATAPRFGAYSSSTGHLYIYFLGSTASKSEAPTFSVEEGTYTDAQTITLTTETEGAKIYYKINDADDYTVYSEPIVLDEDGRYVISAYADATDATYNKSDVVTKTYTVSLPLTGPYELCTNAAYLTEGTKIIFVGQDELSGVEVYYGMSKEQKSDNRGIADVVIAGDNLTPNSTKVAVFTVGKSNGNYTFYTDDSYDSYDATVTGYLYATSSKKDYLGTQDTVDKNAEWTISLTSTGAATITAQGINTHNVLQYNRTSDIFSCYESGQTSPYIYFLRSTSSVSNVSANEGVKVFGTEGGVVVSADNATDVAVYTMAGQLVSKTTVAAGTSTVNVAPGFYVVRAAGTATKVVVK